MPDIDEDIRRRFESDWMKGNTSDIAQYLPQRDSPAYLPTLEELICIDLEFRWNNRSKSADQSAPAPFLLEDYLVQFPELREPTILQRLIEQEAFARKDSPAPPTPEEYQLRFPDIAPPSSSFPKQLADVSTAAFVSTSGAPSGAPPECPGEFGPYQLQSLLGRGGMGSVYLALHGTTARQVAIKIAKFDGFTDEARKEIAKRFQTEVRAAAKITHDHVTPIYDAGEVGGALYYTMPVVSGDISTEVRRQILSNQRAAQVIAQASRGVAAAHRAGLLHRDLKPANLLYDANTDRVLIADFGLARIEEAEQQLTRSNQRLGTPPYMAPEQIRAAKECDHRADIYALGATLYHLLTGRPPFHASSAVETLRQVTEDDPVAPRTLNPAIDRDLETICLRCLHKEPSLRFQTADELAEDLERYQRGEAIQSRPLGGISRLLRWRRRNPRVAALSLALASALLLLALVASYGWYATNQQLDRVVANNRQGQEALNELFTFVRTEPLLAQPGQESVREELLMRGLKHYQALVDLAEENESLPVDVIAARTAIALLTLDLHGAQPAIEHFDAAIAAIEKLPPPQQQSEDVQTLLGDATNGLGKARHWLGNYAQAAQDFDRAIEIRTALAKQAGLESQRKLANALMNRGLTAAASGDIAAAQRFEESAQAKRRTLLTEHARDAKLRRDVAQGAFNLARLALQQGHPAKAEQGLAMATDQFAALTQEYPTDALLWQRYIECLLTQSILESQSATSTDGPLSPALKQAIDHLQPLVMLAPEHRTFRLRLVELYQQAIEQLLPTGEVEMANEAWAIVDGQLLSRFESSDLQPDLLRLRLEHLRQRGLITLGQGDRATAKTQLVTAIEAWRSAAARSKGEQFQSPQWVADWNRLEQLAKSL